MRVQEIKTATDVASITVVTSAIMEWVPPVAALLSIIWMLLRIWETETVKGWTGRDGP